MINEIFGYIIFGMSLLFTYGLILVQIDRHNERKK